MEYDILNAVGIAVLAVFGLWAFQYGAKKQKQKDDAERRRKMDKEEKYAQHLSCASFGLTRAA